MKTNSKIIKLLAKSALVSSALIFSLQGMAQKRAAVISDPKLGKISFTDANGFYIDEAYIQPDQIVKLRLPVINNNHGQALPSGSCKIKIGLGSKLVIDSTFDMNSVEMSKYFKWTSSQNSGQTQITGELVAALPANINDVDVAFKVKSNAFGKSTITANFLVSNHKTDAILSDEDGTNNSSYLSYTVTSNPAPFTIAKIVELTKEGCDMKISFSADKEINLSRYELEASKNGEDFQKVATITASGNTLYSTNFILTEQLQSQKLYVRIKTVEITGRYHYSDAENVNGLCMVKPLRLNLYPNPVIRGGHSVNINAAEGLFNGKYTIRMTDMAGKLMRVKDVQLSYTKTFQFETGEVAAGKYLLHIVTADNETLDVLRFEKL